LGRYEGQAEFAFPICLLDWSIFPSSLCKDDERLVECGFFQSMADPLSLSASIVTVLQLTKDVVQYLNEIRNAPHNRQEMLAEISRTAGYLYMLKDAAEQADLNDGKRSLLSALVLAGGSLDQFKIPVENLIDKLNPSGRCRGLTSSLIWPFRISQIQDLLVKIDRQKAAFMLAFKTRICMLSTKLESLSSFIAGLSSFTLHPARALLHQSVF